MSWQIALLMYGAMIGALLAFGVAIGTVMGLVGIFGISIVAGIRLWPTFGDIVWNTTNSFTLVAVPLFIFMGEVILRSGVSLRFYSGLSRLLRNVTGGLAQSNVVGCAIFAAISGSSTATALAVGTVALPEMRRRGYADELTLGTLIGGGCLGILIPPSIPMVIYAAVVQVSVIDLFIAGIVPGLALTAFFCGYVWLRVKLEPSLVPAREELRETETLSTALLDCLPLIVLILAIIGSLYGGIVTPTEASALGSVGALLLGLFYGKLSWRGLRESFRGAVVTNAVVMFIIINSQILSYALTASGIGRGVSGWVVSLGLGAFAFYVVLFLIYLLLGMFIDGISMMLLTIPILYPTIIAAGFDGVWFGVVLILFIELGQLTPPMGLNLFAVQSISGGVPLGRIAIAAMPYAALITLLAFLLYALPGIALWLPATMKG
jgi:C4-dicarboxylate transporter, DctM subunit